MRGDLKSISIGMATLFGVALLVCFSACDYHAVDGHGDGPAATSPAELTPAAQPSETGTVAAERTSVEGPVADAAPSPRVKLKPGARTKVLTRAGDRPYDKTFDDLRFEMEVGAKFLRSMLTKEIEALDGTKIRIRGYMLFGAQNRGIKQFVLVRDNQECCFGPGAALYDCIFVEMPAGKPLEYTRLPIAVEGIFNIREFVVGGRQMAIYQMDAESVQ